MGEDISKKTLSVLLVMTLIISILSTFLVINALDEAKYVTPSNTHINAKSVNENGNVLLSIAKPEETKTETASISLSIKRTGDSS